MEYFFPLNFNRYYALHFAAWNVRLSGNSKQTQILPITGIRIFVSQLLAVGVHCVALSIWHVAELLNITDMTFEWFDNTVTHFNKQFAVIRLRA